MMSPALLCGDARTVLAGLPAQSVHCAITSPSYYGLRDYGCDGQIGLEDTPQEYVSALVEVFRDVWRVLRNDGTCWIVIGDSYAGSWGNQGRKQERGTQRLINAPILQNLKAGYPSKQGGTGTIRQPGLKPKDLIGIPWMLAFALRDDGWYLRQECIWAKPNPMPSSVKDRCTRAHETVLMLTKGRRYYYDQDAVREPLTWDDRRDHDPLYTPPRVRNVGGRTDGYTIAAGHIGANPAGRTKRSVWTVATAPFSSKKYGCFVEHYAAFPPALVRPMVRAGCPPDGVVLDPFCGSGTTGMVAVQEGRRFVGIDINPSYLELAAARLATVQSPLPLAL